MKSVLNVTELTGLQKLTQEQPLILSLERMI